MQYAVAVVVVMLPHLVNRSTTPPSHGALTQIVVYPCRQVGATAVLLTPVVITAEGDSPMSQAPMSFFAPNPALAVRQSPLAASQELKHVIKQLHAHGIEVILQVTVCKLCDYFALLCISSPHGSS